MTGSIVLVSAIVLFVVVFLAANAGIIWWVFAVAPKRRKEGLLGGGRTAAQRMAAVIGGSCVEGVTSAGHWEIHVKGQFFTHPVQVKIKDWYPASIRNAAAHKLANNVTLECNIDLALSLKYDRDAQQQAMAQLSGPGFVDPGSETLFLSSHVALRGTRDEVQRKRGIWILLPEAVTNAVLALVEKYHGILEVSPGQIQLSVLDGVLVEPTGAERLQEILGVLHQLAVELERVSPTLSPAARRGPPSVNPLAALLGGAPAAAAPVPAAAPPAPAAAPPMPAPQPAGAPAISPGSNVLVAWPDGQRYPARVVQADGERYLCAFAGGSEMWVSVAFVSATAA